MAAIFGVSSMLSPPEPPGNVPDVGAHAAAYAVLAMLVLRGITDRHWRGVTFAAVISAVLVSALYGVTDEWHQSFVPGRTAEARDLVADTIGAMAGAAVVWAWSIVFRNRPHR